MNEVETRIIKKYPNRRLYDTVISSYITLEDVRRLVIDQVSIRVIDARTQVDITHSTLLQIIFEQEENGPPLFSTASLLQMIRFYGGSMQQTLSKLFEQSMDFFWEQQTVLKQGITSGLHTHSGNDGLRLITEFTQNNMSHWQQLQQQWLQTFIAQGSKMQESDPMPTPDMESNI